MTFEEHLEYHEQWLRSMESNHSQIASDLAALTRHHQETAAGLAALTRQHQETAAGLAGITRVLAEVATNQALFTASFGQALGRLTEQVDRNHTEGQVELRALTAKVNEVAEANRKLAETVERYIRFRGDGTQKN